MRPLLEKALDFSRQYADFLGPYEHIADPLIDGPDEGMTTASVLALFKELRAALVPIVRAIAAQQPADDRCLQRCIPRGGADRVRPRGDPALRLRPRARPARQDAPSLLHQVLEPATCASPRACATTTSSEALFSTLHEAGHALYEQGVAADLDGTPLGSGASAGVHESQSRLWENVVGRSRGFWEHFYPPLRKAFPDQFARVPLETFYRAINKVERSLIRTDADEVTYNLHVMMRFDLELELLEGRLAVKDLPEAWRARFEADFGIAPPDDRDGCLQDVHWYAGTVGGAFQGYTIGNILCAQLYAAALAAHPEIPERDGEGRVRHAARLAAATTSTATAASSAPTSSSSARPAAP